MPERTKRVAAQPGPKPGSHRAPHPEGCACPPCSRKGQTQGRTTRLVRIPNDLVDWATDLGGVGAILQRARAEEASPFVSVQVEPDIRARILSRKEGAQAYLERLVREEAKPAKRIPAAPGDPHTEKQLKAELRKTDDLLWQANQRLRIYQQALTKIAAETLEASLVAFVARTALKEAQSVQLPEEPALKKRAPRALPEAIKKARQVPALEHEFPVSHRGPRLLRHEVPTALRAMALKDQGFSLADIALVLRHENLPNNKKVAYWTEDLVSDLLARRFGVEPG